MKISRRGFLKSIGLLSAAVVMPQSVEAKPKISADDVIEDYHSLKWLRPIEHMTSSGSCISGVYGKIVFCGVEIVAWQWQLESTTDHERPVHYGMWANCATLIATAYDRQDVLSKIKLSHGPIRIYLNDTSWLDGYAQMLDWSLYAEDWHTEMTFTITDLVHNNVF